MTMGWENMMTARAMCLGLFFLGKICGIVVMQNAFY